MLKYVSLRASLECSKCSNLLSYALTIHLVAVFVLYGFSLVAVCYKNHSIASLLQVFMVGSRRRCNLVPS